MLITRLSVVRFHPVSRVITRLGNHPFFMPKMVISHLNLSPYHLLNGFHRIFKKNNLLKKIKLYLAMSLNGKIARADGDVHWLETIPNPDPNHYGYYDFYNSIDTTIQGNSTYQLILSWGVDFPYKDKTNYVLTRNPDLQDNEDVTFIKENHVQFIRQLKQQKGKDIWLVGGGQVNTMLWNEGLIDEIQLHVMPIVLSDGIELFELVPEQKLLTLVESKAYVNGVLELKYRPAT